MVENDSYEKKFSKNPEIILYIYSVSQIYGMKFVILIRPKSKTMLIFIPNATFDV